MMFSGYSFFSCRELFCRFFFLSVFTFLSIFILVLFFFYFSAHFFLLIFYLFRCAFTFAYFFPFSFVHHSFLLFLACSRSYAPFPHTPHLFSLVFFPFSIAFSSFSTLLSFTQSLSIAHFSFSIVLLLTSLLYLFLSFAGFSSSHIQCISLIIFISRFFYLYLLLSHVRQRIEIEQAEDDTRFVTLQRFANIVSKLCTSVQHSIPLNGSANFFFASSTSK